MNLSDITTRGWILALFIRDDGERFLLGDGWYDFKDGLQHFQPNTIASDIVELQGTDGQLLAGQVRRSTAQRFNGYIGDSTITKTEIEARRMAFLQFFQVRRSYDVIYIFPDGSSIKRERGYLVEAPSVPEMWQFYPEYSVALNFENVNYYEYAEDDSGQEIFAHSVLVAISNSLKGGLIWDGNGAYSEALNWSGYETESGDYITISDAIEDAPLTLTQLSGNAEQMTYSGKNLCSSTSVPVATQVYFNFDKSTITEGTYTLSTALNEATANNTVSLVIDGTATNLGTFAGSAGATVKTTFTLSAAQITSIQGSTTSLIRLYKSGANFTNPTWAQLEAGSTATDYEPYVGGTASPNPDYPQAIETVTGGQTIGVTGKNLLNVNRTLGAPSDTAFGNTTKRLFDFNEYVIGIASNNYYSANNVTSHSVAGGSITVTTSQTAYGLGCAVRVLPSTTYALSYDVSPSGGLISIGYYTETGEWISNYSPSGAFVTPPNCAFTVFVFRGASANTATTYSNIQLELGSTATTYEPYQAQSYEINLGKNLAPNNATSQTINQVVFTKNDDGSITANGTADSTAFYPITDNFWLEAGTYTLGSTNQCTTTAYLQLIEVATGSPVLTNLNNTKSSTFTITNGKTARLYYRIASGAQVNLTVFPQLERGTLATTYAPYFTPIELAKIGTYQDRIYKDESKWYIEKQVGKVVLSSSDVGRNGSYTNVDYATLTKPADSFMYGNYDSPVGKTISSCAIPSAVPGSFDYATYVGKLLSQPSQNKFWIGFAKGTALTDMQSALDGQTVYYALATATTTEITDETLLSQLNFIANLYGGVNHISLVPSAGVQGTMTVQYATELLPGGGYVWEEGDTGGVTNVNVIGVANAQPIWTVTGPAVDPTLTNITTGQAITWTGTVPNNQTLVVDMGKQTAELNGANVYSGISGDWIDLKIGQNKLTYSAIGGEIPPSKIEWNGVVG